MGYSQFILEKVKNKKGFENLSKKEMESIFVYVGYIEKESKRCKDIVANLLKFSRQSKDAEFTSLNVNKVLEETLIFTRHQMEMNNVEINPKLDKGIPEILGSARQLQQVFTNLIINAQQAMKHGGKLTISTGSPDGFVEICFSDTGEGISNGNIDKLFTPFFTTKEVGEGTGLGLSISYGIIKGHGGKIEVKSEINKGSVFCVILPIKSIIE
jgi:two-component system NtrC family sensor kinase